MHEEQVREELGQWVAWAIGRGTLRSQLGTLPTVPGRRRDGHARVAWYLDMERRLSALSPAYRRMVILSAAGHTQACIAVELGMALRSVVRHMGYALGKIADSTERDSRKRPAPRLDSFFFGPRARVSSAEAQSWLNPPVTCQCWHKVPGPPRKAAMRCPVTRERSDLQDVLYRIYRAQEDRTMDESKPILCLDFDGVIHSYSSPWQGATVIPDPPVPGAEQFIVDAHTQFKVIIHSSRAHTIEGARAIEAYMRECLPMAAPLVEVWSQKPPAFLTIDDRVITFTGVFPLVESIRSFRPWNR